MKRDDTLITPKNIRSARAILGWTQHELAQRSGVVKSAVAHIERGVHLLGDTNVQLITEALNGAGIVFSDSSIAGPVLKDVILQSTYGRAPFQWIQVNDIETWASQGENSQTLLPELICRLIYADRGKSVGLRFPSHSASSMKGWDGRCDTRIGSKYVPAGVSGWEMTVQDKGIKGKADKDYKSHIKNPRSIVPAEATFVFITAHRWENKDDWEKAKNSEGIWGKVLAYDAIDLVDWMAQFPAVACWFSELIGKRPTGLRDLESVWAEWRVATERPMVPELVLSGRDSEAIKCIKWAREAPSQLSLQAESMGEAEVFIYAAITYLPMDVQAEILSRCVVVSNAEQARMLGKTLTELYLILESADAALVNWLISQGHHVCSVYGSEVGVPGDVVRLPLLSRIDTYAALGCMGYDCNGARSITRDIGCSLAVFQRLYASATERVSPDWAKSGQVDKILPAFLAGAWDGSRLADREALQRLSGKPYEEFEKEMIIYSSLPDSPLRKSGSVWKIASPRDALFRLAPAIAPVDLKKFVEVAQEVFCAPDPRFTMAPEERCLAGLVDKLPQHSSFLQTGLGETLLAISLFGEKAKITGSAQVADNLVRILFDDADAIRWWSLSKQLTLFSEAAPEQFLAAVQKSLLKINPPIMELFEVDEGLLGDIHYCNLLWSLESLAWDPKYLLPVVLILAAMGRLFPPRESYANCPFKSLRNIFVWNTPQTCVDFDGRMDVLDRIREKEPEIYLKLVLTLLPSADESLCPSSKPRWREIPEELPEPNYTEMSKVSKSTAKRLLNECTKDESRWVSLIEIFLKLPQEDFEQAAQELSLQAHSFNVNTKASCWNALRQLLHNNRCYFDAESDLRKKRLVVLDPIYASLAPEDEIAKVAWLFNCNLAELPDKLDGGWETYQTESGVRRCKAVEQIWANSGLDGMVSLVQAVEQPESVGFAIAESSLKEDEKNKLLRKGLASSEPKLQSLARGVIAQILQNEKAAGRDEEWAFALLDTAVDEAWPMMMVLSVFLTMQGSRRLWDRIVQFGADVERDYWLKMKPGFPRHAIDDLPFIIEQFLKYKRAYDLIVVVSRAHKNISSAQIIEILREAITGLDDKLNRKNAILYQHGLVELLAELDRRGGVDETEIAKLEWQYFPILIYSKRSCKTLHKYISSEPNVFIELLCLVSSLSSKNELKIVGHKDKGHNYEVVKRAGELLSSWHYMPGVNNGVIDSAVLERWICDVRLFSEEKGLLAECDYYIGHMLAYAPQDVDYMWPPTAVQGILNIYLNSDIELGFIEGLFKKFGKSFRNIGDGGDRERKLASEFRLWSNAIRFKSPIVSQMLEKVAEEYVRIAKMQDEHTERVNLL